MVAATGNGQCIAEKQVSRAHRKQREGGEGGRENEGTGFLFPRQDSCDNQEVSTAM